MPIVSRNRNKSVYHLYDVKSYEKDQAGYAASGPELGQPLKYNVSEGTVKSFMYWKDTGGLVTGHKTPIAVSVHSRLPGSSQNQAQRNKAYSKFKDMAHTEVAELGTAFAEWKESLGMITNRAINLATAAKALFKEKNFRKFLKHLSVSPKKKHRGKRWAAAHETSGLWLEYWFGWSPLVNDIYSGVTQMSEPIPDGSSCFGKAGDRGHEEANYQSADYKLGVRVGGDVSVTNPNLYLANQLGIINPAETLWAIQPMSFFADWCFDISAFLGSFSDFVGCSIKNEYTTEFVKYQWYLFPVASQKGLYNADQMFMSRILSLPRVLPNFNVPANLGVKLTRAASSMAVLTQMFGSEYNKPHLRKAVEGWAEY